MNVLHLAKRYVGSLSKTPPPAAAEAWAMTWLSQAEAHLWARMTVADRRHSIEVARRFQELRPDATREEMAGALLHDVGKLQSGLPTSRRVIATIVGPRTARLRDYHEHEAIGAELAAAAESAPATVALIRGEGPAAADLTAADHI
jgi:HD domain